MLTIKRRKAGMIKNKRLKLKPIVNVQLTEIIDYSLLNICADVSFALKTLCENLSGFQEYTPPQAVRLTYKYLCKVYKKVLKLSFKRNRKVVAEKLKEFQLAFNSACEHQDVKEDESKEDEKVVKSQP